MSLDRIVNFVGIDVSKHWFNVYILRKLFSPVEFRCDNSTSGVTEFLRQLRKHRISFSKRTIVTIEHTGIYTRTLIDALSKEPFLLCLEMGVRIKKGLGLIRGKKDTLDSKRIAEYSMRHLDNLYLFVQKPKALRLIIQLLKNRRRLLKAKYTVETPLKEKAKFTLTGEQKFFHSINNKVLRSIDDAVDRILKEVDVIVENEPKIKRQVKLVMSVPGIGKLTALQLVCDTNCFENCENAKQLASYCGVAPFEISSGISISKAHISKMSNRILKGCLHMATLCLVRHNGELKEYYERKVKEGKPKYVAMNNMSNKILARVWAVIARDSAYIPRKNGGKDSVLLPLVGTS